MRLVRFISAILLSALVVFFCITIVARALTEDTLRQKIESKNQEIKILEAEIKQYQGSIAQTSATAQTLRSTINQLNQEVKNLNYQLKLTQTKISKKELEISVLSSAIDETIQSLTYQQQALAEMIRQLDTLEIKSPLETFFDYQTLSAFFDAIEKDKTLGASIKDAYEKLSQTKQALETQKDTAQKTKTQLVSLKNDLADQRALEEDQKSEKAKLLTMTKNQEARYQTLLKNRKQKRAAIEQEVQGIEDELRRLINPNTIPSKGKGILLKPVENSEITQGFGITSFSLSTDVYKNNSHNGVDFRASIGTPILAADDGIVKNVGDIDLMCRGGSYGRYIVIEHPNNLSTLYGHLSRTRVTPGQKVSRGDIIGLSGNTGYTTGPHLHFTVYASNTFRMARTNNCGLIPAGGYLNPLDYL